MSRERKWLIACTVWLGLLTALVVVCLVGMRPTSMAVDDGTACYTLFIGLNDKDANEQLVSTDEAVRIVEDICSELTDGFSASLMTGVWEDGNGVVFHEETISVIAYGADDQAIHAVADRVIEALNQEAVLIARSYDEFEYYGT